MTNLLEIKDLVVEFWDRDVLTNRPLRGVNLELKQGEILGVVGETGCGKSMTGLSILGLLPAGAKPSGQILIEGEEQPLGVPLQSRGETASIVFQNPMTAFNPLFTIGSQIDDVLKRHKKLTKAERKQQILHYFTEVGLPDPERAYRVYPHEMSGGMLQRAMIAMALVGEPKLLILDEPTTALDVTIAKQILELISDLRDRFGFGVILITHNLGVVHEVCDRVAVLYAGRVIETGNVSDVFEKPSHPYTLGLLGALPGRHKAGDQLEAIPGSVPPRLTDIEGCVFASRCPIAAEDCLIIDPQLEAVDPEQRKRLPIAPVGNLPSHMAACIRLDRGNN